MWFKISKLELILVSFIFMSFIWLSPLPVKGQPTDSDYFSATNNVIEMIEEITGKENLSLSDDKLDSLLDGDHDIVESLEKYIYLKQSIDLKNNLKNKKGEYELEIHVDKKKDNTLIAVYIPWQKEIAYKQVGNAHESIFDYYIIKKDSINDTEKKR